MKKLILLTLLSSISLSMVAQDDDMYFVPTKANVAKEAKKYGMPQNVYYSGSNRSVDDYNRRAMIGAPIDTTANDIIDFSAVRGVYPESDSLMAESEDYKLTRRMSRFDDYTPSEAYWDGYRAGRWSSPWYNTWYSWYDPWYYDSWWYWNDPFYYSSWYSWRYPYYYSWYRPLYSRPIYIGGGYHGGGYRGGSYSRAGVTHHKNSSAQRGNDLGGYRSSNSRTYTPTTTNNRSNSNGNLGGYRSTTTSTSAGSMGGNRSGGFSGGGGGAGRSASGGRSYGGRR